MVYIKIKSRTFENKRFSPLRYWGGLYHIAVKSMRDLGVLVPFDIGVVYIVFRMGSSYSIVLVPFDIGVVYIPSFVFSDRIF